MIFDGLCMGAEKDRGGERGEKQKGKEGVMPNHNSTAQIAA
jgi:hypothetical protein